jgi:hypothetical protein
MAVMRFYVPTYFGELRKAEVQLLRILLPGTSVNKCQGCIGQCYVASFLMGKGTRVNGGPHGEANGALRTP